MLYRKHMRYKRKWKNYENALEIAGGLEHDDILYYCRVLYFKEVTSTKIFIFMPYRDIKSLCLPTNMAMIYSQSS